MQGAVGFLNIPLTTNLPRNLPVKKNLIGSGVAELWPSVCGPLLALPVHLLN